MPAVPAKARNVFGLLALVLSVVGFVLAVIPPTAFAAGVLFTPAIVFAIIGLTRKGQPKGFALAGLLVAIVGVIIAAIVTVTAVLVGAGSTLG